MLIPTIALATASLAAVVAAATSVGMSAGLGPRSTSDVVPWRTTAPPAETTLGPINVEGPHTHHHTHHAPSRTMTRDDDPWNSLPSPWRLSTVVSTATSTSASLGPETPTAFVTVTLAA